MTRVDLYSDEPILAKGMEAVLVATGRFHLGASYSGIPELMQRLQTEVPDILLLDLTPVLTFAVLRDIKRVVQKSRLVLWANSISTELAFQAMTLGVRGILRKTLSADLQVNCLQKVHDGELWFEKTLTDSFIASQRVVLTRREGQLITLLSHGLKNKEIASALQISEGTVKVYLYHLFQKVGAKDRLELAMFGLKNLTAGHAPQSGQSSPLNNSTIHLLIAPAPVAAIRPVRRTHRPIEI
jgi:DNA-binding NarL/FixJ family response regulator